MDADTANASGGGQNIEDFETVCVVIMNQIKARKKELAKLLPKRFETNNLLAVCSASIRIYAMNRSSSRSASKVVDVDEETRKSHKVLRTSYGEVKCTTSDATDLLKS